MWYTIGLVKFFNFYGSRGPVADLFARAGQQDLVFTHLFTIWA